LRDGALDAAFPLLNRNDLRLVSYHAGVVGRDHGVVQRIVVAFIVVTVSFGTARIGFVGWVHSKHLRSG